MIKEKPMNGKIKNRSRFSRFFTVAALALTLVFLAESCKKEDVSPLNSQEYQELRVEMRQLWAEHMEWTYATVDAFFHEQGGLDAKLNRLLLNQKHIGQSIVPYFGNTNGNKLEALLTEHITDAVPVLTAAQNGDNAALETALDDWYANAQEVGDHFAKVNPKQWEQSELRDIWKTHISQTVAYSVANLQGDLETAITLYQEAYDHMMIMADVMAKGIIQK